MNNEWISVYDKFPEGNWAPSIEDVSEQVLVLTDFGAVGAAAYHRSKGLWFSGGLTKPCGYQEMAAKIVYWRPFPKGFSNPWPFHSMDYMARNKYRVTDEEVANIEERRRDEE